MYKFENDHYRLLLPVYVHNEETAATLARIITFTEVMFKMWGFKQRLTDTLRYYQNEATVHCSQSTCSHIFGRLPIEKEIRFC